MTEEDVAAIRVSIRLLSKKTYVIFDNPLTGKRESWVHGVLNNEYDPASYVERGVSSFGTYLIPYEAP
jgi:hypothetical protein